MRITSKTELQHGDTVKCILHNYGKETEEIGVIVKSPHRGDLRLSLPSQAPHHSGKLKMMKKGGYVSAPWGMSPDGRIGARIISKI